MANCRGDKITSDYHRVTRERIVSKENYEKYICPHCEYLLEDAVQSGCGHRLCKRCAESVFKE